eukprot:COSAG06_NODE_28479_length_573_cov_1.379747_1_plen_126_part_00
MVVDSDPEGTAALEGGGETAVSTSSADPKGAEPSTEQVKVNDEPPKTAHAEVGGLEAVSLVRLELTSRSASLDRRIQLRLQLNTLRDHCSLSLLLLRSSIVLLCHLLGFLVVRERWRFVRASTEG